MNHELRKNRRMLIPVSRFTSLKFGSFSRDSSRIEKNLRVERVDAPVFIEFL